MSASSERVRERLDLDADELPQGADVGRFEVVPLAPEVVAYATYAPGRGDPPFAVLRKQRGRDRVERLPHRLGRPRHGEVDLEHVEVEESRRRGAQGSGDRVVVAGQLEHGRLGGPHDPVAECRDQLLRGGVVGSGSPLEPRRRCPFEAPLAGDGSQGRIEAEPRRAVAREAAERANRARQTAPSRR